MKTEWYIDMQWINSVLYADDICLMATTANVMQSVKDDKDMIRLIK